MLRARAHLLAVRGFTGAPDGSDEHGRMGFLKVSGCGGGS